jgi:hypothetical protein
MGSCSGTQAFDVGNTGSITGDGTYTLSPTAELAAGTYYLDAFYEGDANNSTSSVSCGSQTLVVGQASTTTTLSANPASPEVGDSTVLTATVTGAPSPFGPTGTVTFKNGSTVLGTGSVNGSGVATYTTSPGQLPLGDNTLTAVYGGDSNNLGSTSSGLAVDVSQDSVCLILESSENPSGLAQKVTFTAYLYGSYDATGKVTFYDGPNVIGTGKVVDGVATFSTKDLQLGTHEITAYYPGDTDNLAAWDVCPVYQVVQLSNP